MLLVGRLASANRCERAVGAAGAAGFGLLIARSHGWPFVLQLADIAVARFGASHTPAPQHLQLLTFLATVSLVGLSVLLFELVRHAMLCVGLLRRFERLLLWFVPASTVVASARVSPALGCASPVILAGFAVLLLSRDVCKRGAAPSKAAPRLACVLTIEAMALAWGTWLVLAPRGAGPWTAAVACTLVGLGSYRIGRSAAAGGGADVTRDAVAAAPLLVLPLLGLIRAPSPGYLIAAVAACVILCRVLKSTADLRMAFDWIDAMFAPWALGTMVIIPLGFRELPAANHFLHEGFHAAWAESVFRGRWLMADAGLIYGPLREYAIAAYLCIAGKTMEQLRVVQILLALGGIGLSLVLAAKLTRCVTLRLWFLYLSIVDSPLRFFLTYKHGISFGWIDSLRSVIPVLGLVCVMQAAAVDPRKVTRRRWLVAQFAWGMVVGLGVLYSQEHGVVAVAATVPCLLLSALTRRSQPMIEQVYAGVASAGAFVVGAALPFTAMLAAYAATGRGSRFLHSFVDFVQQKASGNLDGGWFSTFFPVNDGTWLDPAQVIRDAMAATGQPNFRNLAIDHVMLLAVFVTTTAVLAVAAVSRRWSARESLMLALLLFGIGTMPILFSRADVFHMISVATPASVLMLMFCEDMAKIVAPRVSWLATRVPVGQLIVLCFVLFSVFVGEAVGGIRPRLVQIANGTEAPSRAQWQSTPEIPRAGDIYVEPNLVDLVRFLRAHTQSDEPIFVRLAEPLGGAEIYFLAERRNPTHFDTIEECTTPALSVEALADISRDPPVFVVGLNEARMGWEVANYFRTHYSLVCSFGPEYPVFRDIRRSGPVPTCR